MKIAEAENSDRTFRPRPISSESKSSRLNSQLTPQLTASATILIPSSDAKNATICKYINSPERKNDVAAYSASAVTDLSALAVVDAGEDF